MAQLRIDSWKGKSTTVDDVPLHVGLFYDPGTSYIYCPSHKDDGSTVVADTVAYVDDYGYVHAVLPGSQYGLQKDWKGYTIVKPIAFCCRLWNSFYLINREEQEAISQKQMNDLIENIRQSRQVIEDQKVKIDQLT